jgi:hypothetical protein
VSYVEDIVTDGDTQVYNIADAIQCQIAFSLLQICLFTMVNMGRIVARQSAQKEFYCQRCLATFIIAPIWLLLFSIPSVLTSGGTYFTVVLLSLATENLQQNLLNGSFIGTDTLYVTSLSATSLSLTGFLLFFSLPVALFGIFPKLPYNKLAWTCTLSETRMLEKKADAMESARVRPILKKVAGLNVDVAAADTKDATERAQREIPVGSSVEAQAEDGTWFTATLVQGKRPSDGTYVVRPEGEEKIDGVMMPRRECTTRTVREHALLEAQRKEQEAQLVASNSRTVTAEQSARARQRWSTVARKVGPF